VASSTVKGYFEILSCTLLGRFLQPYRRRPKRRIVSAPQFYFFGVGVVNVLAKKGEVLAGPVKREQSEGWKDKYSFSYEHCYFHEVRVK
jgi:predicted AAA+ superfamily ATPase